MKRILLVITLFYAASITSFTQNPSPTQPSTRPPEDNDRVLRPITPEEVPPNLNFYAIDPLYKPGIPLGWSKERIEEKLDRGMIALATERGKVYLSWRLLKTDPEKIAFNVYRSTAGGAPLKLNARPIQSSTDFIDSKPSLESENAWWVRAIINGREQEDSVRAELPANSPVQQYRSIKLKADVRSNIKVRASTASK